MGNCITITIIIVVVAAVVVVALTGTATTAMMIETDPEEGSLPTLTLGFRACGHNSDAHDDAWPDLAATLSGVLTVAKLLTVRFPASHRVSATGYENSSAAPHRAVFTLVCAISFAAHLSQWHLTEMRPVCLSVCLAPRTVCISLVDSSTDSSGRA